MSFNDNIKSANKWIQYFKDISIIHGNTGLSQFKDEILKFTDFFEVFVKNLERQLEVFKVDYKNANDQALSYKKELNLVHEELIKEKNEKLAIKETLLKKSADLERERINVKSYSSIVSSSVNKREEIVPKMDYVCIVDAVDNTIMDSKQTLSYLNSKLDYKKIIENNIKITKQIPIRNKKVLLKCPSKSDCVAVGNVINNMNCGLLAKIPVKKKPRLLILGVEKEILDQDLKEVIMAQNEQIKHCLEDSNESLEVITSKIDRVGTKMVVLNVSPRTYKLLLELGHVFL
ncbi:hypothetical protein BLA29_007233, partial [Euroglyphus maynei]